MPFLKRINPIASARPPLGIRSRLVWLIAAGIIMQIKLIKMSGIAAIFTLFAKYLRPSAPKSAGTTLLNAGRRVSD